MSCVLWQAVLTWPKANKQTLACTDESSKRQETGALFRVPTKFNCKCKPFDLTHPPTYQTIQKVRCAWFGAGSAPTRSDPFSPKIPDTQSVPFLFSSLLFSSSSSSSLALIILIHTLILIVLLLFSNHFNLFRSL